MNAALQRAIDYTGSQSALARAIAEDAKSSGSGLEKTSQQLVRYWLLNGVPAEACLPIYRITQGRCTPHELNRRAYPEADYRPALESSAPEQRAA